MVDGNTETTNDRINKFNIINLVAYILNVGITYSVGVGGFFDLPSNGELSQKYQTLVTPVGFAFAIWSIIFLAQAVWVLYQLFAKSQRNSPFVVAVGYNYLFVCLAQAGWTFAFSTEVIWLSLIFMLSILFFLWRIVLSLQGQEFSFGQYALWKFPFTIHTGWITAASFVNANVLAVDLAAGSTILFALAATSLVLLLVIGAWVLASVDVVIPLVLAWALMGVYVELGQPGDKIVETFSTNQIDFAKVGAAAFALILALGVAIKVFTLLIKKRSSDRASTDEGTYLRHNE